MRSKIGRNGSGRLRFDLVYQECGTGGSYFGCISASYALFDIVKH